jgi:hypothetical protein
MEGSKQKMVKKTVALAICHCTIQKEKLLSSFNNTKHFFFSNIYKASLQHPFQGTITKRLDVFNRSLSSSAPSKADSGFEYGELR